MEEYVSDPSDMTSGEATRMPFVTLGAVAVTAGLTAYLAWQAHRPAPTREHEALIAYLHDHLSGSDVAVRVVHGLDSAHQAPEDQTLFRRLSREFEDERAVVRTLLAQLGASGRSIKRAAAVVSGRVLSATAGGDPGDLSLLRTLEALAIGVQGKRCLWRTLQSLDTVVAPFDGVTFVALEAAAVRQWEAIEERRRTLVVRTFRPEAIDPSPTSAEDPCVPASSLSTSAERYR